MCYNIEEEDRERQRPESLVYGGTAMKFYLKDDCESLLCKLENAAYESFMEGDYARNERLEDDRDRLEDAINQNDASTMRELLEKYSYWFKRYT